MATKKNKWFSFRTALSILTLGLVFWVIYENREGFVETFHNLNQANIFVILLLVPEQLFMYYACGQIFFTYLESKYRIKFQPAEKLKISTELNFVNRAVPAGAVGGLAYLTYRLKPYGVTAGQASFLYIFRFAITTVVNYVQALIAILILYAIGGVPAEATWIIWVSLLMNAGVFLILGLIIYVASSKRRIEFFAHLVERSIRFLTRLVTFGKKRSFFKKDKVQEYFLSIHDCVLIVKKDKRSLIKPTIWGFIYSLCEIGVYWIVAASLGHPEILPVIMVGEAIGSVFDGLIPYGPYELGMTGVMGVLLGGSEEAMAISLITVVMARALSLMFTIGTGYWPYNQAIRKKGS
ncbi:flippase-like domain-containing protein [Candidatus Saccharibacteria bacterium]|nr:flippase-like domain-containing protein [Candidatus Saccharibacteria bacterium]